MRVIPKSEVSKREFKLDFVHIHLSSLTDTAHINMIFFTSTTELAREACSKNLSCINGSNFL